MYKLDKIILLLILVLYEFLDILMFGLSVYAIVHDVTTFPYIFTLSLQESLEFAKMDVQICSLQENS